jgi:hypothetical protein
VKVGDRVQYTRVNDSFSAYTVEGTITHMDTISAAVQSENTKQGYNRVLLAALQVMPHKMAIWTKQKGGSYPALLS